MCARSVDMIALRGARGETMRMPSRRAGDRASDRPRTVTPDGLLFGRPQIAFFPPMTGGLSQIMDTVATSESRKPIRRSARDRALTQGTHRYWRRVSSKDYAEASENGEPIAA